MNNNVELEAWRASWRSVADDKPAAGFDLRLEARRHERRLRTQYILGLGFAVALFAFAAYVLQRNSTAETLAWAIVVWLTTFLATAFSIWNWRILWNAVAQSTAEYVSAYRARCMATLRAVRFGYGLLVCQLAITVPWLTWDHYRSGESGRFGAGAYAFSMGLLAVLTATYLYAFGRSRRCAVRELAQLEEFEQSYRWDFQGKEELP